MKGLLAIKAIREFPYSLDGIHTTTAAVDEVVVLRAGAAVSLVAEDYAVPAVMPDHAPQAGGEVANKANDASGGEQPDMIALLAENVLLRQELRDLRQLLAANSVAPTIATTIDSPVDAGGVTVVSGSGDRIIGPSEVSVVGGAPDSLAGSGSSAKDAIDGADSAEGAAGGDSREGEADGDSMDGAGGHAAAPQVRPRRRQDGSRNQE